MTLSINCETQPLIVKLVDHDRRVRINRFA